MPFLDVNVFRENGKFVTNVYRRESFAGVLSFMGKMSALVKSGLARSYINVYLFVKLKLLVRPLIV